MLPTPRRMFGVMADVTQILEAIAAADDAEWMFGKPAARLAPVLTRGSSSMWTEASKSYLGG
jgi:hypothetical protein